MRTEAPPTAQPPPTNWSLIACYENFFPATRGTRSKMISREQHEDLTGNSRGALASSQATKLLSTDQRALRSGRRCRTRSR